MNNWIIRKYGMGVVHLLETLIKCFMVTLREKDIPGASLNVRDPGELKVPELKR